MAKILLPLTLASTLVACGGGGSSADTSTGTGTTTNNASWVSGTFANASQFKGQCQAINEKTGCLPMVNCLHSLLSQSKRAGTDRVKGAKTYYQFCLVNFSTEN